MQLNQHHVPETRLYPDCINEVKTIFDATGSEPAASLDVAKMLGYKSNTTGAYYRRLEALEAYGLIERHGKVRVSSLGKRVTYPESENNRDAALKEAVLHVPLWAELYKKFGKSPPSENFWVQLKNITGIEAPLAQRVESVVRKWYLEDVAHVVHHFSVNMTETVSLADNVRSAVIHGSPSTFLAPSLSLRASGKLFEPKSYGVLTAAGIGQVDIVDRDTLVLARSMLNIIEKKIKSEEPGQLRLRIGTTGSFVDSTTGKITTTMGGWHGFSTDMNENTVTETQTTRSD